MCPDYSALQTMGALTIIGVAIGLAALMFACGVACGKQLQTKREETHVSG